MLETALIPALFFLAVILFVHILERVIERGTRQTRREWVHPQTDLPRAALTSAREPDPPARVLDGLIVGLVVLCPSFLWEVMR